LRRKAGERAAAAAGEAKEKPAPAEKEAHDRAVLWAQDGKFVRPVKVQIGLSDGAMTEIVKGDLEPGAVIVIGQNHAGGPAGPTNPSPAQRFGGGNRRQQYPKRPFSRRA